jgi:3-(3-hydroxy-phenyl)propionate hydroxylase
MQISDTSPYVVVVGLGPVGITLCNILGRLGIDVLGVDTREDVYALPRAIGMDHEVMRVFQNIGVADQLAEVVGEYRDSIYRAADGTVLRQFVSPPPPHKLGWPAYLTFVQPQLERVLRDGARAQDSVTLLTGVELTSLKRPEAPIVNIRDVESGDSAELHPRFVIGCDGGPSLVRRTLDIKFEDLIFDQPWLVIDVIVGEDVVGLPETNMQFCDPSRPHTFVVLPGRLRRWEFMLLPGEIAEELNRPDRIWELLSPWLKPRQAEIWRSATYRFHALVAETWRVGNVFLAGDACHMTPPFLAQGMVQGIKDVANLGWKLAAVLKGAPDALLDTYEQERRPLVHKVISITKELGEVICEIDPARAEVRNERMKALVREGKGVLVRQDLFPPISDGLIARDTAGTPAPGAGEVCPQPWIGVEHGRSRLDDLGGNGFTLMTYGLDLTDAERLRAGWLDVVIHEFGDALGDLREEDGVLKTWLSSFQALAVLARPDHVVFGVACNHDDLAKLFDQLEARMGRSVVSRLALPA